MKILHVTHGMDPKMGGVCQAIRTMIVGLEPLNVFNEVASLDASDAPYLKDYPFLVHALGPANGPWAYSSKLIPWLNKNIARFDTVIIHGMWLFYGYAVRKAINRFREQVLVDKQALSVIPKLFVMPHGMLDPYFQRAPGRKLKALRNNVYWKLIENKVVNDADGIFFTCEEECKLAKEPFRPYYPKCEKVVGLGIEQPPAFTSSMATAFYDKCSALGDNPFILFLSRIHEKKGVDILLKAYENFISKQIKPEVLGSNNEDKNNLSVGYNSLPKLVIAGPGIETSYGQELQQFVRNSEHLQNNVFFPGMLTGEAKWGAFYNSQAFILPSHQENFGIAVVEAMACGRPVLISNQVNIWREISDTGGGIFAADNLKGTTELLERWHILAESEKRTYSLQARKCYENNFAINAAAKRLLETISN